MNHHEKLQRQNPSSSLLLQRVFAIAGKEHVDVPKASRRSRRSFFCYYDPSKKDSGCLSFAEEVINFESLALRSTFATPNITPLPLMDTAIQQTIADLNSVHQAEKKSTCAQFAKLKYMMAKIMSMMEQKLTLSPLESYIVSSLN